jgi:hypothetical protein
MNGVGWLPDQSREVTKLNGSTALAQMLFKAFLVFRGTEHFETTRQVFVHEHHGRGVVELSAVVGGAEDGDQPSLARREELVATLHHLMRTHEQLEPILEQKLTHHVPTEEI